VNWEGLVPGMPIARRLPRDGRHYWIGGYEVFDPEYLHSITGSGLVPLKVKRRFTGEVAVVRAGQEGKPVWVKTSEVRPISPGLNCLDFSQVFGRSTGAATELSGIEIEEVDDLSLGLGIELGASDPD
jgi:hypothetical protein